MVIAFLKILKMNKIIIEIIYSPELEKLLTIK